MGIRVGKKIIFYKIVIYFLIIVTSVSNEMLEKEILLDEKLENIYFGDIEKSRISLEIETVKISKINGRMYGIITFNNKKKNIIKKEKTIEINGAEYKFKVVDEKVIEVENQEKNIFYLKTSE
ncbi:MAG: hypothetical protein KBE73_05175 [Fusobacteriaceae bacterium]|nr:hypothetical protein [Fusobacteriaceae bacterium]